MNTKKDIRTTRKKIIATLVGLVLTTIAFIGGTVAYFTDTVETTNVIKSGSIKITQTETDRNGNPFVQNLMILPAVLSTTTESKAINGANYSFYNHANAIDKVVTVNNVGKSDAYVRTLILVPVIGSGATNRVQLITNQGAGIDWTVISDVEVGGVMHQIFVATYDQKLTAGKSSSPSLLQVYLAPETTSEDLETAPDITVRVISQAMQVGGFENVSSAQALDTGFGAITATNHPFN